MITVTEPQVWTMMGVLAAGLFGMLTLMSTMFTRIIRAEIGGVRSEIGSVRNEIRSEINGVHTRIDGLQSEFVLRFDAMSHRIDGLDRDIHFLMNRGLDNQ